MGKKSDAELLKTLSTLVIEERVEKKFLFVAGSGSMRLMLSRLDRLGLIPFQRRAHNNYMAHFLGLSVFERFIEQPQNPQAHSNSDDS